jgi:hypothetical protein
MTTPLVGKRQTKAPRPLEPGGLLGFEGRAGASLLPFLCCCPPPAVLWLCPVGQPPYGHAATHRWFLLPAGLPAAGQPAPHCRSRRRGKRGRLRASRLAAVEQRDAHRLGLVGEVVRDAGAGEHDDADRHGFQQLIVALENGAAFW